jgi:flavorubredoxin
MDKTTVLYDDGHHRCIRFYLDEEEYEGGFLSVSQYLIMDGTSAILLDAGSADTFAELFDLVGQWCQPEYLQALFFSHQDPDVAASIGQWSTVTPAKIFVSKLWVRFMGHYGFMNFDRIVPLEDEGQTMTLGTTSLHFVPSHFLHSPGNFCLFDPVSKILFSGDIGAAIVSPDSVHKGIENFEIHKVSLEPFHKRYMHSNAMLRSWVNRVRPLGATTIAPQHGPLIENENVEKFYNWLEGLQCGSDLLL